MSMANVKSYPVASQVHSGKTLESYVLPHNLRINADMSFANAGMEVIKVSKNGKQQIRRIAIAPNHRAIYITTNRPQGGVLGRIKAKIGNNNAPIDISEGGITGAASMAIKEIDLSMVVRIQSGQQSRRFERARSKSSKQLLIPGSPKLRSSRQLQLEPSSMNSSVPSIDGVHTLSIIYRPPTFTAPSITSVGSAVKENFVNAVKNSNSPLKSSRVLDSGEDSLDLIILSKKDYDALARTLEDLLEFYKEVEPCKNPDFSWIQYHLVDMGKKLGTSSFGLVIKGGVSCSEWITLCNRWNAPVSKEDATMLYDTFVESLEKATEAEGLNFLELMRLLDVLRKWIRQQPSNMQDKDGKECFALEDPCRTLFQRIAQSKDEGVQTRIVSPSKTSGVFVKNFNEEQDQPSIISASAFLKFLITEQKETDATIGEVKSLFARLNGDHSSEIDDVVSTLDGVSWEKEYITLECFQKYLLLKTNDLFNPERASLPPSYMNEPLSNYWINTSHDTYLRRTNSPDQKQLDWTDLQSYTLALYRGARAIEIDVWDGPTGTKDPVVRSGTSSFSDDTVNIDNKKSSDSRSGSNLIFSDVIQTVKYFLQSEPNSYPIILLIENHCSLPYQEKMASDLENILEKNNLLYRPESSSDELLPSPSELIGKVVIKCKRPDNLLIDSSVLNDDFDDETRAPIHHSCSEYDSEDDIREDVIGFKSTGTIKSAIMKKCSLKELYQTACIESSDAISSVAVAQNEVMEAKAAAVQAQRHANALLRDIGMSHEELIKKRSRCTNNHFDEGTEVELFEDGPRVKESYNQAIEMAKALAESVEESRLVFSAAKADSKSETELFEMARGELIDKETMLANANESLQEASKHYREIKEAAERTLSDARSNREYADNAERRVTAVRALLNKSHNQATSSETVAGTADTEAKISEKRAQDAEARAKAARNHAEQERIKADEETKLEDDLMAQLDSAKSKLSEAQNFVKAARDRANDAVSRADQLTDELREMKSLTKDQQDSVSFDDEKSLVDERKAYIGQMEDALMEKLLREAKSRQLVTLVEDLQRKTKLQGNIAASARRQADHALIVADQLEEHALEEREAANLRCAAHEKAKLNVKNSDAMMHSTEAQLVEAERAATELNKAAILSRQNAERLAKEAKEIEDLSTYIKMVETAKEKRDLAHDTYEKAKESKERADQLVAEAQQAYEKDCINLKRMEREAVSELLNMELVQQAEVLAINACENARAQNDKVLSFELKLSNSQAYAVEKTGALEIATRYKEKMIRVQPLSHSLAKLTLLHSCKHKKWEKSLKFPYWKMHNIPENLVLQKAEKGKEEWKKWVDFNKYHMTRTFPQSSLKNYNPLLSWALGCQFVSMNFIRNQFMLLNDGRFRENGNQGYVLKPEYLCSNTLNESRIDDVFNCANPRVIKIQILSGYCLPKSIDMSSSSSMNCAKSSINPFVRIILYDGSPVSFLKPASYSTGTVKGNGLNPVWNEEEVTFTCLNPSVGMILIAVYDHCEASKIDLFIGASTMPVSCIREGYRSLSLFDSNNRCTGSMRFASLLIKVNISSS